MSDKAAVENQQERRDMGKLLLDLDEVKARLQTTAQAFDQVLGDAENEAADRYGQSAARVLSTYNVLSCITRDFRAGLDELGKVENRMYAQMMEQQKGEAR